MFSGLVECGYRLRCEVALGWSLKERCITYRTNRATYVSMQTDPCVWFVHAYVHIALFPGRPPLVGAGAVRPSFPPPH